MEKPMTNTRFNTLPMACDRGATRSNVFVATWMYIFPVNIWYIAEWKNDKKISSQKTQVCSIFAHIMLCFHKFFETTPAGRAMHMCSLSRSILASSPERLIYCYYILLFKRHYMCITHLDFGYRINPTLILLYLSHIVQLQLTNVIHCPWSFITKCCWYWCTFNFMSQ